MSKHVWLEPATIYKAAGGRSRFFTKRAAYREAAKVYLKRTIRTGEFTPEDIDEKATELQAEDEQWPGRKQ